MALYTVCFMSRWEVVVVVVMLIIISVFRPDSKCHVVLGGADVYIQTWTFSQAGEVLVGSAYPDWAL